MEKFPGLIIFWTGLLIMGACYSEPLSAAQTDSQAPEKNSPGQQGVINRPKVTYKAQGTRDPFWPLVTEKKITSTAVPEREKVLPNFTVQGLVWGGVFPQAIINNQVVKKGDMLGEAKIIEIGKEGVTVLFAGQEYILSPVVVSGQQPAAK
ncbi:MAG: hypothetical protein WC576_01870 [Candidatus Omnitrophota bacterium]|jgi:hypothetical protein